MNSKVLKVFYGADNLPYKDKERVTHFPILGNAFMGASNTTEIWFYFDKIGEPNNTWVAIAKLPNGKRGAVKLDTYNDTELNEPYAKLQLNTWFTQMRGDVYISLNGYDGGITLSLDQDTGLYEVTGTPVIQATGSVKLTIQYATQLIGGDEIDEIELTDIYAMFGEKLDTNKGIVVIANPQVDITQYDNWQYFYSKSDNSIYENVSGILTLRFTAYSKSESDSKYFIKASNNTASGTNTFSGQNTFSGRAVFSGNANLYNTYLTTNTKNYFARVGTTTSQYVMYKLPYNYSDLGSEATYTLITKEYTDTQLALKVDKTTTASQVYATNYQGNQTTIGFSSSASGTTIALRDSSGQLNVALTPTANNNATSKKYVDDGLSLKANQATTYTKTEVDNLIDTIKSGELEIVDTTTYPTLNDFLATTGEEGHIYLYPIDINDLTKGYYRYVWEEISGSYQWVSLGTTEIDLSDYYTKTQADNKFVEQVSGKGLSSNDFTDNDKNKLDGIESGAEVNVIEEITVDNVALVPVNKSVNIDLSGKQDTLVSGTNIKSINNTSLLGSGNYTFDTEFSEVSTNALENRIISKEVKEINYELAVIRESLFETILAELDYTVDYATTYAIPDTLNDTDGTHRVVYSETELKKIEGNSFVWNNQITNGNFTSISGWTGYLTSSFTVSNNIASFTANALGGRIYRSISVTITGHKYLMSIDVKLTTGGTYLKGAIFGQEPLSSANTTTWQRLTNIVEKTGGSNDFVIYDGRSSDWDEIQVKNVIFIDLTQMFPTNTPTTTDDPRVQWAIQYALDNPSYNAGALVSTTTTGIESKSSTDTLLGTISVPETELISARTVHNYIEVVEGDIVEGEQLYNLVKHNNVGSVDLGTLDWTYYNSQTRFYAYISDAKFSTVDTNLSNILCGKYEQTTIYRHVFSSSYDKTIAGLNTQISIRDTSYNNATTFKQAMSGAYLYYELATPTTEVIATGLHFNQVSSIIEQGGTIISLHTNTPPNITTTFVVKKAVGE